MDPVTEPRLKFPYGKIVGTPGAIDLAVDLVPYFHRHVTGDWGDLCDEDKAMNDEAVELGNRILSAYDTPNGKLWIITEADRSVTTFLLPSEY